MNEFNTPEPGNDEIPDSPPTLHQEKPGLKYYLLEKEYFFGLNGPWLVGILVGTVLACWYIFGSAMSSSSDELNSAAGFEDVPAASTQSPGRTSSPLTQQAAVDDDVKKDVATMVNGVKTYAEANRTAIQRLAESVKTLQQQAGAAQQLQGQYLDEINILKSRVATLETEKVNTATSAPQNRQRSLTSGMKVSSVQDGAAWIFWKNHTWAVREGDALAGGKVKIISIDATNRQVFTSEGVIR
ncbi:conjugal transfer protein TraP [Serratia ficaria]|uniref:conjugal transfer protein TraP n=1 Tax=Serratia ficaria TaxID=61651 RepID=UPI00077CBFE4|nr:conjugal transfer protein TraP [Serratia ficaria]